ncbi:MAG: hypothetical protein CM15mP122_4460 [Bacteroidota bacterium]|nr:MAG: hypothetical protein CM15mP122_4460 [Bacteroidota bacterium]
MSSKKVKNPEYVRYGWKNYFEATFFNNKGFLPHHLKTPLKIIFVDKPSQNQLPFDLKKKLGSIEPPRPPIAIFYNKLVINKRAQIFWDF